MCWESCLFEQCFKKTVWMVSCGLRCARWRRVTYTTVDSRRRVVVWTVVMSTSVVADRVAVGVGTQSPICLLGTAACLLGAIKSRTKRSWSGTRAYYRGYAAGLLLACRAFSPQKSEIRTVVGPPLPSRCLTLRRMRVCNHENIPRISRSVLHIARVSHFY